jgi:hypothetical protein
VRIGSGQLPTVETTVARVITAVLMDMTVLLIERGVRAPVAGGGHVLPKKGRGDPFSRVKTRDRKKGRPAASGCRAG